MVQGWGEREGQRQPTDAFRLHCPPHPCSRQRYPPPLPLPSFTLTRLLYPHFKTNFHLPCPSAGNVYHATICRLPCCTCVDFTERAHVCKHLLFVYLKVTPAASPTLRPNTKHAYLRKTLALETAGSAAKLKHWFRSSTPPAAALIPLPPRLRLQSSTPPHSPLSPHPSHSTHPHNLPGAPRPPRLDPPPPEGAPRHRARFLPHGRRSRPRAPSAWP
jgi:hypothetical protein